MADSGPRRRDVLVAVAGGCTLLTGSIETEDVRYGKTYGSGYGGSGRA